MRILVVGAGGTGGYFGGRLAQSGANVTFLVRAPRAEQLRCHGLQLRSPLGDADLTVTVVTQEQLIASEHAFDLVLLSCKAYDLENAMASFAPAVADATTLLPILNGLRHYSILDARFESRRVLGGLCFISATKQPDGRIRHMGKAAKITFGERFGTADTPRTRAFEALCRTAGLDCLRSERIAQQQWEKYTFLTALAAATCVMRTALGPIIASEGGVRFITDLYRECLAVAAACSEPIAEEARQAALNILTQPASPMKASMLRDIEAGYPVEARQIVGDMLERARACAVPAPLLNVVWVHLQAYENARAASA